MRALTVRIEDGRVVASDDSGRTARLDSGIAETVQEAWRRADQIGTHTSVTAAALAAIGEAKAMRPRNAPHAPDWRTRVEGPRVPLGPFAHDASRPLRDVLMERRSERAWSPPTVKEVANMLVRAARVAGWEQMSDSYISSHRPTPSAGARHPLDLHLLAGEVKGLASATYVFDAVTCELVLTGGPRDGTLTKLAEIVGASGPPPAAVVAVAHGERTLSRYPGGLSLVWRDAGVLLGTLHLCCTDLGLASCIVGTCGLLIDERSPVVVDVGCVLLGARPVRGRL